MPYAYVLALPVEQDTFSEVPKLWKFLKSVKGQVRMSVLIDEGGMDRNEFDEIIDYHNSAVDISERSLPDDLVYVPPTVHDIISCSWAGFCTRLEVLKNICDVHLWMLAVHFLYNGTFLIIPEESSGADLESIAKDWAFRSDFVESGLLAGMKNGALEFQWLVLSSVVSKKSGLPCLVFLSKDVDVFERVRLCCESDGLVIYGDLDF